MISCRLCGQAIHFSNDQLSELTPQKIPLDETGEPHNCTNWKDQNRGYYDCRNCGKKIYFDDQHKPENDKFQVKKPENRMNAKAKIRSIKPKEETPTNVIF